jgi:hypothetical protein
MVTHQCAPAVLQNINILMVTVLLVGIMNAVLVEEVEALSFLTAQNALMISVDVFHVKLELNMCVMCIIHMEDVQHVVRMNVAWEET